MRVRVDLAQDKGLFKIEAQLTSRSLSVIIIKLAKISDIQMVLVRIPY
jgi:hypothetical protein